MCQEIEVDGKPIERNDKTCWCPLSADVTPDGATAEQEKAFAEFGRKVFELLCQDKHPSANRWSAEVTIVRW